MQGSRPCLLASSGEISYLFPLRVLQFLVWYLFPVSPIQTPSILSLLTVICWLEELLEPDVEPPELLLGALVFWTCLGVCTVVGLGVLAGVGFGVDLGVFCTAVGAVDGVGVFSGVGLLEGVGSTVGSGVEVGVGVGDIAMTGTVELY